MIRTGFPAAPAPVTLQPGQTLRARLTLRNSGGQAATVFVTGALLQGGAVKYTFTVAVGQIFLAPGQQASVDLSARPTVAGTYDAQFRVGPLPSGDWLDQGIHPGVVRVVEAAAGAAQPSFRSRVGYSPTSAAEGERIQATIPLRNSGSGWLGGVLRGIIYAAGGNTALGYFGPAKIVIPPGQDLNVTLNATMPGQDIDVQWSLIWGTVPAGTTTDQSFNTPEMLSYPYGRDSRAVTLASGGGGAPPPPSGPAQLVIGPVSYAPSSPAQCQQVRATVPIRNVSGQRYDGNITLTGYTTLVGASEREGNFFPTAQANLGGPPGTTRWVGILPGDQLIVEMWTAGIGVGAPMDAVWSLSYSGGSDSRRDSRAITPTFTGNVAHCPPWY